MRTIAPSRRSQWPWPPAPTIEAIPVDVRAMSPISRARPGLWGATDFFEGCVIGAQFTHESAVALPTLLP